MGTRVRSVFSFPNPVNEVAARVVAGGVVVLCVVGHRAAPAMAARPPRLRLLGPGADRAHAEPARPAGHAGHRSPARASAPRLVAGPPKRFAQAIGRAVLDAPPSCCGSGSAPTARPGSSVGASRRSRRCSSRPSACAWAARSSPCSCGPGLVPDTVCAACADITPVSPSSGANRPGSDQRTRGLGSETPGRRDPAQPRRGTSSPTSSASSRAQST